MKNFSIIVAIDKNRGIGKDGGLAWHLPLDMKHFKETTMLAADGKRNAVVMGRKTWESIPERFCPLPNRLNVVLTRNDDFLLPEGCLQCSSLEDGLERVSACDDVDKIFVVGGANIYEQAIKLPECKQLYITMIQEAFDCDVFFPDFSQNFDIISQGDEFSENGHTAFFQEYYRKV